MRRRALTIVCAKSCHFSAFWYFLRSVDFERSTNLQEDGNAIEVGAPQFELWMNVDADIVIEGTIAARNVTLDLPENDHGVKCFCRFIHSRLGENGWRWGSTWTEGRGCQELLKRPAPLIRALERGLLQVMKDHICIS